MYLYVGVVQVALFFPPRFKNKKPISNNGTVNLPQYKDPSHIVHNRIIYKTQYDTSALVHVIY
jgi:hypothetical protein